MEVQIDKQLKDNCNVNLGCIFYKTNVIKTNKELWNYIDNQIVTNIQKTFTLENLTEQINIKTSREAYKILGKEPSR